MSERLGPIAALSSSMGGQAGGAGSMLAPSHTIGSEPVHPVTHALHGALMTDAAHGLGGAIGGQPVHPITQFTHSYLGKEGRPIASLTQAAQDALGKGGAHAPVVGQRPAGAMDRLMKGFAGG